LSLSHASGHGRPFVGASVHAATGEQRPDTLHYLEAEEYLGCERGLAVGGAAGASEQAGQWERRSDRRRRERNKWSEDLGQRGRQARAGGCKWEQNAGRRRRPRAHGRWFGRLLPKG
jgi:hypothetical protein